MKNDFLSQNERRATRQTILLKIIFVIILWGILSLISVSCFFFSKNHTQSSPTAVSNSNHETERFYGHYINDGTCEKTSAVAMILDSIESQPLEDPRIRKGITYKDFIYYHVTDPEDCNPSAKHPDFSVLITISDRSLISSDSYWVNYIISMNDIIMDLTFDVSYDLKSIFFVDLQIRDRYQYWFEDHSQEVMRQKLADTVIQFMPGLATNMQTLITQEADTSYMYLFPSDTTYITESDLQGLTKYEVALIRNEIYARHGYIFKTEEFKLYFDTQSWYVPNPNFSDSLFNSIERANIAFILQYEEKMDTMIRNENFEQLVDFGQHPNYEVGVFSTYFYERFDNDISFSWDYLGATYSTFTAENETFDSFDVFRVNCPNDSIIYYLVPFTGQDGILPIIYQFSESEGLIKVWERPF